MLVFVFGSNLAGSHGGGAARIAVERYGAVMGKGTGYQGQSYAIPTLGRRLEKLPLWRIRRHVRKFLTFARANPQLSFYVTPIGTGIAGYRTSEIRPMFDDGEPPPFNVAYCPWPADPVRAEEGGHRG